MSELDAITASLRDAHARFAAIIETIRPELHRYCARMTGSALDGEDLVQEALAQACFRLPLVSAEVPLRPWLFTIAHHRCVDFLRARSGARAEPYVDDIASEAEMDFDVRDLASRLFGEVVLDLPPRERAAVILKDVLDYSLAEIAEILETSVGGVKAALHRGRTKLAAAVSVAAESAPREPDPAVAAYIETFNRRDWTGLVALLADEVQVEVVGRVQHRGHDEIADNYIATYSQLPFGWRLVAGTVDGEPALICLRNGGGEWTPRHAIRLSWRGDRVAQIRDYAHIPYLLADAKVVFNKDKP
jgi:RNA polymerase sigma-70 factor (ECF subfamily)